MKKKYTKKSRKHFIKKKKKSRKDFRKKTNKLKKMKGGMTGIQNVTTLPNLEREIFFNEKMNLWKSNNLIDTNDLDEFRGQFKEYLIDNPNDTNVKLQKNKVTNYMPTSTGASIPRSRTYYLWRNGRSSNPMAITIDIKPNN